MTAPGPRPTEPALPAEPAGGCKRRASQARCTARGPRQEGTVRPLSTVAARTAAPTSKPCGRHGTGPGDSSTMSSRF